LKYAISVSGLCSILRRSYRFSHRRAELHFPLLLLLLLLLLLRRVFLQLSARV
jgi:hypothetical protein